MTFMMTIMMMLMMQMMTKLEMMTQDRYDFVDEGDLDMENVDGEMMMKMLMDGDYDDDGC